MDASHRDLAPLRGRVIGVQVGMPKRVDGRVKEAVYAYAIEDTRRWEGELGRPLGPGAWGESLTTEGSTFPAPCSASAGRSARRRLRSSSRACLIPRAGTAPQLTETLREQMAR